MKYIARDAVRIGGVTHAAGDIVDVLGREQMAVFGDKLMPITDPKLIRIAEINSHPYMVLSDFRWGRVDYHTGSIFWAPTRSVLRYLPPNSVRPASGDEVLSWLDSGHSLGEVGEREPTTPQPPTPPENDPDPTTLATRPTDPRLATRRPRREVSA